ncbi:hypothetical protein SVIO_026880 [Streptomyces violaceusniger]|uniref:Uncharacterized protein n=1 Tax=Streptomyces violaceusniger TaxID=68280 RepID=A0A4D4KT01_STRVO|nr:hypothetical protein SVIO_026880 [Streptomyces violaceusniger]
MSRTWAGTDYGKAHHHCPPLDSEGETPLSRRAANGAPELLTVSPTRACRGDQVPAWYRPVLGAEFLVAIGGSLDAFPRPPGSLRRRDPRSLRLRQNRRQPSPPSALIRVRQCR